VAQHPIFARPLQRGKQPIEKQVKWKCKHFPTITFLLLLFLALHLCSLPAPIAIPLFVFCFPSYKLVLHCLSRSSQNRSGLHNPHLVRGGTMSSLRDTEETRNQCRPVAIHSIKSSCVSLLFPSTPLPCLVDDLPMHFSSILCCWSSDNIKNIHSDDKAVHTSKVPGIKVCIHVSLRMQSRSNLLQELPSIGANHHQPVVPSTPTLVPVASTKSQPPGKKPSLRNEPYSSHRAQELFKTYADSDDPNVIGPEGFEQLCNDADMPLEGARPIIFAWQFGAKEMAKISKEEWIHGTSTLKCVSSIFRR
jgi:hypothetical protein